LLLVCSSSFARGYPSQPPSSSRRKSKNEARVTQQQKKLLLSPPSPYSAAAAAALLLLLSIPCATALPSLRVVVIPARPASGVTCCMGATKP